MPSKSGDSGFNGFLRKHQYGIIAIAVVFIVLFADQFIKIWIKTHFCLGESYAVFNSSWFIIHFTENNGMAFGMELAGEYGKLFLTLFRIVASGVIIWYIYTLIRKKAGKLLIITISLVLAGAMGNIFDSVFYGLIFSESTPFELATLFPEGGGYASLFHGRVVDMLYFPVISTTWPSWMPFVGGEPFEFFQPVFNIADTSITVGVLMLLVFYRKMFPREEVSNRMEYKDPPSD